MAINERSFLLKKLHSLSGLFFRLFLLEHFFTNSFALFGREAYGEKAAFLQELPYLLFIEIFLLAAPILFHAGYGFYITYKGENNALTYGYVRNWLYFGQRVTGAIAFFYIVFHVVSTRFTNAHGPALFDIVAESIRNPLVFAFYTLGIAAASFHFGNGLWGFCFSWGVVTRARSQRNLGYICIGIGLLMFFIGMNSLLAFLGMAWVPGANINW